MTAFYDIDTPVTLAKLARGDFEYLSPELIPGYDIYLSFTGGPTLRPHRAALRLPRRPRALLLGRSRRLPRRWTVPEALGPLLSRHLQRRSPADAGAAADRARPRAARIAASPSPGRNIPTGIDWPAQCRADRASAAGRARRILLRVALHPERHPRRHDRRRLVALGAAVRGRRLRARRSSRTAGRASRSLFAPGREIMLAGTPRTVIAGADRQAMPARSALRRARACSPRTPPRTARPSWKRYLDEAAADRANRTTKARAG